jgi:glutathione synthase/RimK-type ligase-like ATP-grasp enzyme
MRLAWATASEARGKDPDEPLAVDALRAEGVRVDVVEWDNGAVEWTSYDVVLVRSTWDYTERLEEFVTWLQRVDGLTVLRNPIAPMRWSADKHYLAELADAGVPVIPTLYVAPGERVVSPVGDVVVKPTIGAGAQDVALFRAGDDTAVATHVERIHRRGVSAMVQPLLPSVARTGEWPMVFLGGRFSHSANKHVQLPDPDGPAPFFAPERNRPWEATLEQRQVAEHCMAAVEQRFGSLTYARVDLVRDDDDRYLVLEVELVEPSLFLPEGGPGAVANLVRAVLQTDVRRRS